MKAISFAILVAVPAVASLVGCSTNDSGANPGSGDASNIGSSGAIGSGADGAEGASSSGGDGSSSSSASEGDTATSAVGSSGGGSTDSGGLGPSDSSAIDSGGSMGMGDAAATDSGNVVSDAGEGGGTASSDGSPYGPNLVSAFDGSTLDGWIQVPASSWSVVGGAMHSLGSARGYIYTKNVTYGDFRFIFMSRLVGDPANHNPCVLFWGNSFGVDALAAIQIQPPPGYMWDYRKTGPTANQSPDRFETRFGHPAVVATQWSQCEMLGNQAAGTLRFACCQLPTGIGRCKASEIIDFKDPTAGRAAPLALQVHNAGMIEEFKNLWLESPVADPSALVTTQ